jgi:hypothetical protein
MFASLKHRLYGGELDLYAHPQLAPELGRISWSRLDITCRKSIAWLKTMGHGNLSRRSALLPRSPARALRPDRERRTWNRALRERP